MSDAMRDLPNTTAAAQRRIMASTISLPDRLIRFRRSAMALFSTSANVVAFVGIALLGGLATSWYMIDRGSPLNAVRIGSWTHWTEAGRPGADPYTRARFTRQGSLPLNAAAFSRFEAITDGEGRRLHSSCDYLLEGRITDTRWWAIAAFTESGRLIANPADRYGFDTSTLARAPDGRYAITLSRDVRPGNWLPTATAGRMMLVVEVQESGSGAAAIELPVVRRVACS